MTKTFIFVVIILAILAYIMYNLTSNTSNESFRQINTNNPNVLNISNNTNYDNYSCEDEVNESESQFNVKEDDNELIINDSVVEYEKNSESDEIIKKKFITRNHPKKQGIKNNTKNFAQDNRGGVSKQAIDYIDESNDLIQSCYSYNDEFIANDDGKQYAPYKATGNTKDKFKTKEIFNSQNYLPNEKSVNPDCFDIVPEPISVKNRHLINVSKSIGINTIGTSLRNPGYDIRGSPPVPKFVISPWMQSTIEPDNNYKSLCD